MKYLWVLIATLTLHSAVGQSLEVVYNSRTLWNIPKLSQQLSEMDSEIQKSTLDVIRKAQKAVFVYKLTYVDGVSLYELLRVENGDGVNSTRSLTYKDMNKRMAYLAGGTIPEGQAATIDMKQLKWNYVKDTLEVLGYPCLGATSEDIGGMKLKAWYAPDIPVMDGPHHYVGLPGLIMKLVVGDNTNTYEAVSVKILKEGEATVQMPQFEKIIDFEEYRKSRDQWRGN